MIDMANLYSETDPRKWADAWMEVVAAKPEIATDHETMVSWFANAMMAGYDKGIETERKRGLHSIVTEIAYQCAGAGSGAVMAEASHLVMPTREIEERVGRILREFGIVDEPVAGGDGG